MCTALFSRMITAKTNQDTGKATKQTRNNKQRNNKMDMGESPRQSINEGLSGNSVKMTLSGHLKDSERSHHHSCITRCCQIRVTDIGLCFALSLVIHS